MASRDIWSHPGSFQVRDLLASLLAACLLAGESEHPLYVCSPYLSDFPLFENALGQFTPLFRHKLDAARQAEILFSETLAELAHSRPVRIIGLPGEHAENFLRRVVKPENPRIAARHAPDSFHEKGLLCPEFYVAGSMNLTYSGVYRNEEKITVHTPDTAEGKQRIAAALLEFERLWNNRKSSEVPTENMNAGQAIPLLTAFNQNWGKYEPEFALEIAAPDVVIEGTHPLYSEVEALCSGRAGSLPNFRQSEVFWCTVAPDGHSLRAAVQNLQAWILPSLGGVQADDGFIPPGGGSASWSAAIQAVSPAGYFRWRCRWDELRQVCDKFNLQRGLEKRRPQRSRPPRPSLYELRARFSTTLLAGDRLGAEKIIELVDNLQLDTAMNTQFMRVRLWHHFHEFERIRDYPSLPALLSQPLPPRVQEWIEEANPLPTSGIAAKEEVLALPTEDTPRSSRSSAEASWLDWFTAFRTGNRVAARLFLEDHVPRAPGDFTAAEIQDLVDAVEEVYLDDALRQRERDLLAQGMAELLEETVREPEFPRELFGSFYLALLRVWGALHAGNSSGHEHGHVLLELAHASLQLNRSPTEVVRIVEQWWEARPVLSQLPFVLDAIELLERESADRQAPANLWLAAADLIRRASDDLLPSEKALWRRVGVRLGIDGISITHYLPGDVVEEASSTRDVLKAASIHRVAIVSMREEQAREAAQQIQQRTGAEVQLVTSKVGGAETDQARSADVVLFVWLATSHAVFRAFDGFDRKRFCYVQGTGVSSIVRTLERWVTT